MRKKERKLQLNVFGMMTDSSMSEYGWSPANQEYDYETSSYTYESQVKQTISSDYMNV